MTHGRLRRNAPRRVWLAPWVFAITGILVPGCATYHATPVDAVVQPPDEAALRVAAAGLHHPALPPMALHLDDGLSPDEAAVLAVLANPGLRAVRAQRGVARANLFAAGILPDPALDYEINAPTGRNASGEVVGSGLRLGIDLQALITRGADRTAAGEQLASVDLDIAWQEWQVAQQARLQVYRIGYLTHALAYARDNEAQLEEMVGAVQEADRLRLVTAVDVAASESAMESARQVRLAGEQELARARMALNAALGFTSDQAVPIQMDTIPPPEHSPETLRWMVDSLRVRRLDLLALERGYNSQDAALHAAILRQFPAINIGVTRAKDTGNFFTIGPAISLSLPFFDRNRGQIAIERATGAQLRQEYAARLFQAQNQVDSLFMEERIARDQLAASRRLVTVRQQLETAYRAARDAGDADAVTYYQIVSDVLRSRMDVLRLEQTLAEINIALDVASGGAR